MIKVKLLVAGDCQPCAKARSIWEAACAARGGQLSVIDVASRDGRALFEIWRLGSVPAVLIDGELMAIGVQTPDQALKLLSFAQGRGG